MVDQTANFVRGETDSSVGASDTTISVVDAAEFPDPANGEYNLTLWNGDGRPDQDPDAELVRVTGRDTGTNDLTVTRAQEGTSDVSHPTGSALQLGTSAKIITDLSEQPINYVFDPNGPFEATNASSLTATLADTYDIIKVAIKITNHQYSATGSNWALKINGLNSGEYDYYQVDGVESTNSDGILLFESVSSNSGPVISEFQISGDWNTSGDCSITPSLARADITSNSSNPINYASVDATPPLTSISVTNLFSDTADISMVVLGRDI